MKRNSLAWVVLGALAFAAGGVELAACSDSNSGGTGFPTQPDATNKDAKGGDSGEEEGDGATGKDGGKTDGGGGGDAAKECGAPDSLHPRPDDDAGNPIQNFLCPFSAPQGQKWKYCDSGTHCCVPPANANQLSTCEATACPNEADGGPYAGRDFACLDDIDCPGTKCCGIGQVLQDPECGNRFGKGFRGTKCAASCDEGNGEFKVCQTQTACAGGQTCEPMSAGGAEFGACL